ncbi:MAG: hypothetical protein ACI90V_004655, partial [Bacillariaceae sp.]
FFYIHSDCNYCLGGRVSPLMEGKHKENNVLKNTYRFIESIQKNLKLICRRWMAVCCVNYPKTIS